MKVILICLVLIVGHHCWPVDQEDYGGNDLDTSSSSEETSHESSDLIKVPNYGPRAYKKPKKIDGATKNPGEYGRFAEGDIRLTPNSAAGSRSGLRDTWTRSYRWRRGRSGFVEVPLKIEARFDHNERANFLKAVQGFAKNTCVRFVQYTNQPDYVAVTNNRMGCFATLGRNGGRQDLNLQSNGCLYDAGTPAHELMHALGIVHEQSRPDRDNYVEILKKNIDSGMTHNFDKYSYSEVDNFGLPYKYDSVMHYDATAFSVNGRPTIVPKLTIERNKLITQKEYLEETYWNRDMSREQEMEDLGVRVQLGVLSSDEESDYDDSDEESDSGMNVSGRSYRL